jgi:hypothetical protein
VQEGLLERHPGGGRVERYAYGKEGLRFTVQSLKERVRSLEQENRRYPSADLARVISTLKGELAKAEAALKAAPQQSTSGSALTAASAAVQSPCPPSGGIQAPDPTPTIPINMTDAFAVAQPLPPIDAPGVTASASASFYEADECGEQSLPGNTYAYAYARATPQGSTVMSARVQEDPKYDGVALDSAASASVSGSLDCYSEAYARAWDASLSVNYESSQTNSSCPGPAPTDQVPFPGRPATVPGTIKAGDFDQGGEGIAYHDSTAGNAYSSAYRTTDVDMYDDIVVYPAAGEWLEYTIDVATAGTYALVAQVAAVEPGGTFHLELDGVDVTGSLAVPPTGGWAEWGSAIKSGVRFPAGRHVLRVAMDSGFDGFSSLRIVSAQVPFGGTPWSLPGTINVADFDEGGEQISYHDVTAGCKGFCPGRTTDVDRWEDIVFLTTTGEWLEYTVHVAAAGTYTLSVQAGAQDGGATFHVAIDGVDVTGPLTMPTTGSWSSFQAVTKSGVAVSAGLHVLRLAIDHGNSNGTSDAGSFRTLSLQP